MAQTSLHCTIADYISDGTIDFFIKDTIAMATY